jgi:hypothetical protein
MAVYNSASTGASVRSTISEMNESRNCKYADRLALENGLARGLSARGFTRSVRRASFAVVTNWCAGEFGDGDPTDPISEDVLAAVVAGTRGAAMAEAVRWLAAVRAQKPSWLELKAAVHARFPNGWARQRRSAEVASLKKSVG